MAWGAKWALLGLNYPAFSDFRGRKNLLGMTRGAVAPGFGFGHFLLLKEIDL
jgi:hypothetical protein